jgi:hypothetical protein
VKNENLMQALETPDHLNEHLPDVVLFEQSIILLMITYLLKEITIVRILHDDTINFQ